MISRKLFLVFFQKRLQQRNIRRCLGAGKTAFVGFNKIAILCKINSVDFLLSQGTFCIRLQTDPGIPFYKLIA